MHDFWVYRAIFGEFQPFITDFRSMTKRGKSMKPNLSLHNMKVAVSLATH